MDKLNPYQRFILATEKTLDVAKIEFTAVTPEAAPQEPTKEEEIVEVKPIKEKTFKKAEKED